MKWEKANSDFPAVSACFFWRLPTLRRQCSGNSGECHGTGRTIVLSDQSVRTAEKPLQKILSAGHTSSVTQDAFPEQQNFPKKPEKNICCDRRMTALC